MTTHTTPASAIHPLRTRARVARERSARQALSRGSVVVSAVIAVSLILIVLIGTQVGYVFYIKRELQKTADLAALSGAQAVLPASCAEATAAAVANAAQNMPPLLMPLAAGEVTCGHWDPATRAAPLHFGAPGAGDILNAVHVTLARSAPVLLPGLSGNQAFNISVESLAARRQPMAALSIRSTIATVDSQRSALLNAVVGGMLGGALNVDALGWNGLVNTNVKLLTFVDELGIQLGIGAGKYEQVLQTDVSVGTIIEAMIKALEKAGATADATVALGLIKTAASVSPTVLKLGDLLGVQSGMSAAGLNADLQLFQLVQGVVQAANGKNALVASLPITVPGVLKITTNVKVIEPPQFSAVGNPSLAKLNPTGPDQIYVRTGQIRTLVSLELPVLSTLSTLVNAVTSLASPVTTLLNNLLSLKLNLLDDVLGCLIACTKDVTDVDILPAPTRLDISLDAGGGESRVTDFSCPSDAKTLTTETTTSIAKLRIGKLGSSAEDAKTKVFSSNAVPNVSPVPVIDIGSMKCTRLLLGVIPVSCDEANRKAFYGGGLGLRSEGVSIGQSSAPQTFMEPPELADTETPTPFLPVSSSNLVASLNATVQGLDLFVPISATGSGSGGTQSFLSALTNALGTVISVLQGVVSGILTPLLGTLVDVLLGDVLGVNLAQTEVGARLTCAGSAELVY